MPSIGIYIYIYKFIYLAPMHGMQYHWLILKRFIGAYLAKALTQKNGTIQVNNKCKNKKQKTSKHK